MLCFNLEKLKFQLTPKSLGYQNKGKKILFPFLLPPFFVLPNVSSFVHFLHVGVDVSFHKSGVFYFNFYLSPQKT